MSAEEYIIERIHTLEDQVEDLLHEVKELQKDKLFYLKIFDDLKRKENIYRRPDEDCWLSISIDKSDGELFNILYKED